MQNPVKISGLDIGLQHDLILAGNRTVRRIRQGAHPCVFFFQLSHLRSFGCNICLSFAVCSKPGVDILL